MTDRGKSEVAVLLIEDNPDDARFVERCILEARQDASSPDSPQSMTVVQIDRVERLGDGLDQLRREAPDAVLLDLTLPDSSGLETLDRTIEHEPRVPVVVLTGRNDVGIGVEAIQRGAQDYLRKSDIRPSLLRRTLRYAIERKRNQLELRDRTNRLALLNRIVRQDIRNDVSMIVGRADELRGAVSPDDEETLEGLLDAANHAIDLVDTTGELLNVLSSENVEPTPRDLRVVLDAAISRFEAEHDAEISLTWDRSSGSVTIYGTSMLESVFLHLLTATTEYTAEDRPELSISVEVLDDNATVTIARPVQWLPESRSAFLTNSGGDSEDSRVGVGLYFVRTVLNAVEADIEVERLHSGGTAVAISLPRTQSR